MASQMFESEEGESDDERIPPADQAVREPETAAMAVADQIPSEWMRNITSSLVSLQTSFSLFTAQQESDRRNRRRSGVVVSSADER